jgi:hypothetical protein
MWLFGSLTADAAGADSRSHITLWDASGIESASSIPERILVFDKRKKNTLLPVEFESTACTKASAACKLSMAALIISPSTAPDSCNKEAAGPSRSAGQTISIAASAYRLGCPPISRCLYTGLIDHRLKYDSGRRAT